MGKNIVNICVKMYRKYLFEIIQIHLLITYLKKVLKYIHIIVSQIGDTVLLEFFRSTNFRAQCLK